MKWEIKKRLLARREARARGANPEPVAGNPASRKIADATVAKLADYGIQDMPTRAKCMGEMGKATARYFARMQPYAKENRPFDHLLKEWTEDLKGILNGFGITDNTKQEDVILEYLGIIEASL